MEVSKLLLTVGQVAGIGGISLGVLLLIFRDVVRKNIFPTLGQGQAYRVITLIVILTFSIAACGLAAWVYVQTQPKQALVQTIFPPENPEPLMKAHLQLIDDGKYEDAYAQCSRETKQRFQKDFFINAFESQRRPQGKPLTRSLYGITTMRQLPDQTQGAFATGTFLTNFENGGLFMEAVTLIAEDGAWKVLFHQVAPCKPPYCKQN